ncbi:v-trex-a [Choristoneura murinana nucleopolyhedrovirus]|uniref:V-trex-a n=1 Tax=Choristoneura murinana nucleopolyhedrovirus TaxID=1987479 RepID=V9XTP8_9ABAC|nr:v-trex-a [Choristoneura murinana nucleopolyhedrovirus]AHD25521.1 v-trex-a [Choristoneura murinana nucleopolyhedrovirus]
MTQRSFPTRNCLNLTPSPIQLPLSCSTTTMTTTIALKCTCVVIAYTELLYKELAAYYIFSSLLNMASIETYVFLDLQTTGMPEYENNKTQITELGLQCVTRKEERIATLGRGARLQQINYVF